MIASSVEMQLENGHPFDILANDYDSLFTQSIIGRAQRSAVWKHAAQLFPAGGHILELNCGTGEDALYLSRLGLSVVACDVSPEMIKHAKRRQQTEAPGAAIQFNVLASEKICDLQPNALFDGVFSNFSGLNCVTDLPFVISQLAGRVKIGAPLLLCLSTRVCLWEIAYFSLKCNFRKAFRRCGGKANAQLGDVVFPVQYPTVAKLRTLFAPAFHLRSYYGIGVTVPPSYLEYWASKHSDFLRLLQKLDTAVSAWPGFRVIGDHVLLHLERVPS